MGRKQAGMGGIVILAAILTTSDGRDWLQHAAHIAVSSAAHIPIEREAAQRSETWSGDGPRKLVW